MILFVHYFGFKIQNIEELVKVCRKFNVLAVEDCAHLYNYNLFDYSRAGTHGDFTFYSLHKYFPFKNGGMIFQNNHNIPIPNFPKVERTDQLCRKLIKYNSKGIADKRKDNFVLIDKMITEIDGIRAFKKMGEEDIPHNYPVIVENGLREKLYFWLLERNIPLIALYYRLITPLQVEKYASMHYISNNILNLPVHQDIDRKDIVKLIDLIREFYEN